MLYLYAFLPVLAVVALVSAAWQYIFHHFIDLAALERHVMLAACLWFVTGWYMEATAARDLADLYVRCADDLTTRIDALWRDVIERLSA